MKHPVRVAIDVDLAQRPFEKPLYNDTYSVHVHVDIVVSCAKLSTDYCKSEEKSSRFEKVPDAERFVEDYLSGLLKDRPVIALVNGYGKPLLNNFLLKLEEKHKNFAKSPISALAKQRF